MISQKWKRMEMKTKISYDRCTFNVKLYNTIFYAEVSVFVSFSPALLPLYHPPLILYFYLKFTDRDERCAAGRQQRTHAIVLQSPFLLLDQNEWGSNDINWCSICVCICGTSIVRLNRISRWATDYITTKWIVVNSIVFHNSQTYAHIHTQTHMCVRVCIFPFSIVFHFDGGGRVCWTACAHTLTLPQCVYKTHIFHPQCVLFIYMHAMWERRFIHRNKTVLATRAEQTVYRE